MESTLKKIVLYGAFDRYNYGDNIMPILFQMFVEKYAKHILEEFEFEFAAISQSNLSHYLCKETKSINELTQSLPANSVIVVVGGEVLCTKNQTLYLHMQGSSLYHFALKIFRKVLPALFAKFADTRYSAQWEYPFIPPKKAFSQPVNIVFNTVGGDVQNLTQTELADVSARFANASYFSVRDVRTYEEISPLYKDTVLAPDSAYIMSDLLAQSDLEARIDDTFVEQLPVQYVVFQAAPGKVGCSANKLTLLIDDLASRLNKKVVLLPIGYASGHDDHQLLNKVHRALPKQTVLLHDLNIWQIMYVIKNAELFLGTSLHGVITAMSYSVPHYGINPLVQKLDAFLQEWSVAPFNQCYDIIELPNLPSLVTKESSEKLKTKSNQNIALVKANYHALLASL